MSAPIAHIVLALLMLPKHFPDKDVKEFIIGTSFPDIRYLGSIEREKTHYKNITLDMIKKAKSSFEAGMLFHSLVDETRKKYMLQNRVYEIIPNTKNSIRCLKFFEDILVYDQIQNWDQIADYFDTILFEETLFGIPEHDIKKWHQLIQLYCKKRICPQNGLSLYLIFTYTKIPKIIINCFAYTAVKLRILPDKFTKVIQTIDQFTKDKRLKYIILNFYNNFEDIIKNY
ncbi:hypothetical protein ACFLYU_04545 [Candidatus Dependentiae bacterium]